MKSNISIEITLDEDKTPEAIEWKAPEGGMYELQQAKGLLLGLWDGEEKTALRIDMWVKKMMVDEMNEFFYQTLFGMADTYERATQNPQQAAELREFAKSFYKNSMESLEKENK